MTLPYDVMDVENHLHASSFFLDNTGVVVSSLTEDVMIRLATSF